MSERFRAPAYQVLPRSWAWLILLPGTWAGCSKLPDLKPIALDGLAPAIRSQLQESHRKASSLSRDPLTNGRYGMLCHAYQRWEAAEAAYQRATALSPKSFEWQYYLGVVQQEQRHDAQAAASFRRALQLKPGDADSRRRLAECLLRLGKAGESEGLYRDVLRANPADAEASYGLGAVLLTKGDRAAAVDTFEAAWLSISADRRGISVRSRRVYNGQCDTVSSRYALRCG